MRHRRRPRGHCRPPAIGAATEAPTDQGHRIPVLADDRGGGGSISRPAGSPTGPSFGSHHSAATTSPGEDAAQGRSPLSNHSGWPVGWSDRLILANGAFGQLPFQDREVPCLQRSHDRALITSLPAGGALAQQRAVRPGYLPSIVGQVAVQQAARARQLHHLGNTAAL